MLDFHRIASDGFLIGDMSKRTYFVVLVVLLCMANIARWGYRSRIAHPRFVAEGAAHFRYTEMIARGEAPPAVDRKAQWPEGLRVYRETSIGMEYLYGFLYRLIPARKPELTSFIRFFTAFFFSLAMFPMAFLSERLWRSRAAALLTAALFAVSLPLVARSSGFELIRENITFPLLIYHVFFFVSACSDGGWRNALLSGALLSLALVSWQGTQFYLVPFLLFLVARRVLAEIGGWERRSVSILILFSLAAGASVPFLREGGFLLSVPTALCAAWIAADLVSRRAVGSGGGAVRGTVAKPDAGALILRTSVAVAALACILVPAVLLEKHFSSYSHFFNLVLYKLRYVYKPADPKALPFAVRAFWVGPFHSPDPLHFFVFALPTMLILPGPVERLLRRSRQGDFEALFTITFLAVFFLFFILIQRLLPLFGVFAALAGGGNAIGGRGERKGGAILRPSMILTLCVIGVFLMQDFAWEGGADIWRRAARALRVPFRDKFVIFPVEGDVEGALLSWIERNTKEESVIMSLHYLSPQVLTYTGRGTNLNDFFESPRLRRKAKRFLEKLYSSEGSLLEFCRENSSDYLLVSAAVGCDPTRDSPLYQAGLADVPPRSAAYGLLFEPSRLDSFNLVYENEMYRLFSVGQKAMQRMWPRSPLFYEAELLWRHDGDISAFYGSIMRIYALTARGRSLLNAGRPRESEAALTEALRIYYFYPAWSMLSRIYSRSRRLEERESLSEYAYRYDPYRPEVCIELARSRLERGSVENVREILMRCVSLNVSESQLREIRRLLGELDELSR